MYITTREMVISIICNACGVLGLILWAIEARKANAIQYIQRLESVESVGNNDDIIVRSNLEPFRVDELKDEPEVVMPKKCKGCDSASKIIEAYSRGFEDGAEAVKAMPQTEQVGVQFGEMDDETFKSHCLNCQRDTADIKCLDCDGNKYFLPYGSKTDCAWK